MRIDAENGHRRVTRSRLRIIKDEMQRFLKYYLQVPYGRIEYNSELREVGYGEALI